MVRRCAGQAFYGTAGQGCGSRACLLWRGWGHYTELVRLTPHEIQAIRSAATEVLWPGTRVCLFGSRVDDAARGGDIDLLVQPPESPDAADWVARRQRLVTRLYRLLEERRIDVVLDSPAPGPAQAFAEAARRQAVELVQT